MLPFRERCVFRSYRRVIPYAITFVPFRDMNGSNDAEKKRTALAVPVSSGAKNGLLLKLVGQHAGDLDGFAVVQRRVKARFASGFGGGRP